MARTLGSDSDLRSSHLRHQDSVEDIIRVMLNGN